MGPSTPASELALVEGEAGAHGRGLFAARALTAGEQLATWEPLVSVQTPGNDGVLACGTCGRTLGSVGHQLLVAGAARGKRGRAVDEDAARELNAMLPLLADPAEALLAPACPCVAPACDVWFCSEACSQAEWHRLLCPGRGPGAAAAREFLAAARNTDHTFLLAGRALCALVAHSDASSHPVHALHSLRCTSDYMAIGAMHLPPSWQGREKAYKQRILARSTEAFEHLREAIRARSSAHAHDSLLASPRAFLRLLAVTSQNSVSAARAGPVHEYLLALREGLDDGRVASLPDGLRGVLATVVGREEEEDEDEEDEGEDEEEGEEEEEEEEEDKPPAPGPGSTMADADLVTAAIARMPHFEGSSIFGTFSLLNHSCAPNVSLEYLQDSNRAALVVLTDIAEGEELCISYVDETLPDGARQAALRPYGFACDCPRCPRAGSPSAAPAEHRP